ncbi:hypothetical protein QFZ56_005962 [Streptomyces achromogenes]|uniref:Uncharacterized protein n=1 Tax=Streptomyces achromogenes TaxID=67255 RepID=A0ABU0Q8R0_STRAH|nr:hypothetical protein [Streptomyces achromogenes]
MITRRTLRPWRPPLDGHAARAYRNPDFLAHLRGGLLWALLFNQIAGGKSPRLSLGELTDLGVDVAIYSTPCLFAAHEAVHSALAELKRTDGRLPVSDAANGVGVATATRLLEGNIAHRRPAPGDASHSRESERTGGDVPDEVNAGVR